MLYKIYNSLSSLEKKELEEEVKKRLPAFWKERLKKEKGKLSKLTESALEEKRREVIRHWLKEGKIKKKDPLTKTEKEGIKEVEKAFGGEVKFVNRGE